MTEQFGYVEEISRAAAQIKNAPGTRQVELGLTNSPNVDSDPTIQIQIFWPVRARIGHSVTLANFRETNRIDGFDDPFFVQRKPASPDEPERMFSRAGKAATVYELSYFVSKSHLKIDHTL